MAALRSESLFPKEKGGGREEVREDGGRGGDGRAGGGEGKKGELQEEGERWKEREVGEGKDKEMGQGGGPRWSKSLTDEPKMTGRQEVWRSSSHKNVKG